METCVLLSIKPEFVESIFLGTKQFEFRRKIFKNPDIKRVIVYATSPVKKVVGEFQIDEIIQSDISVLWNKTKKYSGIGKTFFESYFNGIQSGYAIRIMHAVRYESPLQLDVDFDIDHAPQFFVYLNDLPECISKIEDQYVPHGVPL